MRPNDPTSIEQAERQLAALRGAIRYRNPETGRRHHVHQPWAVQATVAHIRQLRRWITVRRIFSQSRNNA